MIIVSYIKLGICLPIEDIQEAIKECMRLDRLSIPYSIRFYHNGIRC
jgi:hypothetical protein